MFCTRGRVAAGSGRQRLHMTGRVAACGAPAAGCSARPSPGICGFCHICGAAGIRRPQENTTWANRIADLNRDFYADFDPDFDSAVFGRGETTKTRDRKELPPVLVPQITIEGTPEPALTQFDR